MTGNGAPHVLTIDLEDWFHCLEPDPGRWAQFARRIEQETERLLVLLAQYAVGATFFVLGDVAATSPQLVRRIAGQGHEIGSHSMRHRLVYTQTPAEFRDDLRQSLDLLASITGTPVRCYRAPCFSITAECWWALRILREEGIAHDSSIFPVRNPRYGVPGARTTPHEILAGLWEWPITVLPTPFGNVPLGGGVYFRFWPWRFTDVVLRRLERHKVPIVFYLHPWELDADQPRYRDCSWFLRFRHYYGLRATHAKFRRLLQGARYMNLADGAALLSRGERS